MKRVMLGMLIVGLVGFGLPGSTSADPLGNTDLDENVAFEPGAPHQAGEDVALANFVVTYEPPLIPMKLDPNQIEGPSHPGPPPIDIVKAIEAGVRDALKLGSDDSGNEEGSIPPTPPGEDPPPKPKK